jgi:predicted nucleic acid-binding protein
MIEMAEPKLFFDTNVLLTMHDAQSGTKGPFAQDWFHKAATNQAAIINLQVLNELAHVLLRKRWMSSADAVFEIVDHFSAFGDTPLQNADIQMARRIHELTHYS